MGASFETYLRRHWDVQRDVVTTSPRRLVAGWVRDKAFKIASDQKYGGYQRGLASMVYKFFDKKSHGSGLSSHVVNNKENIQLANELHKPIIRKFKKRKVYSSFRDIFEV